MVLPLTRYAASGDVHVAYQVVGDSDVDLVFAPGTVSHLDLDYGSAADQAWVRARYLSFCRLIRFDKRGTGLSDRIVGPASLGERTDDIRAVMDAAGSHQAAVLGDSEGGAMAMMFAATYPERTRALVVWGGQARWLREGDWPWGMSRAEYERIIAEIELAGVTEEYIRGGGAGFGPDAPAEDVAAATRIFQAGASPSSLAALERMNMSIDIRDILPSIHVPTLVINATEDPMSHIEGARYLAERIPGARLFAYEGRTHSPTNRDEWAAVLDEIQEFVTGARPVAMADRALTTVLFTDIVDSTATVAREGDTAWGRLVERHHSLVRGLLARYRGVEIDTAGDGFFATFDSPARAVLCASDIVEAVRPLGLQVRAGVHTGEVETIAGKSGGMAVVIGARIAALGGPSEVLTSQTVKFLTVGTAIDYVDLGEHELKGVPDTWRIYRVAR